MVARGAQIVKYANNEDSAREIIRKVLEMSERSGKLKPLLQKELIKNPLVVESTAGRDVKQQVENKIKHTRRQIDDHAKKRPARP